MKKVILIGNNESITTKTIHELELDENSLIILFNHHMPIKWEKIKNHKKKIVFLRYNGYNYHGESLYRKNRNFFIKACHLHQKYLLDEKQKIEFMNDNEYKSLGFGKISPSSGICAYLFTMKYLYDENTKVYLIGFTLNYPTTTNFCHSKNLELNFYQEELKRNPNLIKIDK